MKRNNTFIRVILITAMLFISVLGISYASWSDNLNITTAFKVGNIEISVDDFRIKPDPEGPVSLVYNKETNSYHFEATLHECNGSTLTLFLKNTGSLPVYVNNKIIKPYNNPKSDTIQIHINEGFIEHQIKYTLFKANENWEKHLTITGNFIVAEKLSPLGNPKFTNDMAIPGNLNSQISPIEEDMNTNQDEYNENILNENILIDSDITLDETKLEEDNDNPNEAILNDQKEIIVENNGTENNPEVEDINDSKNIEENNIENDGEYSEIPEDQNIIN